MLGFPLELNIRYKLLLDICSSLLGDADRGAKESAETNPALPAGSTLETGLFPTYANRFNS